MTYVNVRYYDVPGCKAGAITMKLIDLPTWLQDNPGVIIAGLTEWKE
jgi:hypothetical protein